MQYGFATIIMILVTFYLFRSLAKGSKVNRVYVDLADSPLMCYQCVGRTATNEPCAFFEWLTYEKRKNLLSYCPVDENTGIKGSCYKSISLLNSMHISDTLTVDDFVVERGCILPNSTDKRLVVPNEGGCFSEDDDVLCFCHSDKCNSNPLVESGAGDLVRLISLMYQLLAFVFY